MRPDYVQCYYCKKLVKRELVKGTQCWLAIAHIGPDEVVVPVCDKCWKEVKSREM